MSPRRLLCLALLLVLLTTAAAADDLETTVTRMAKIGACISGVVNFETFFANTEPWMAAISTVEYEDPETEAQLLRDLSPIHEVDRVQAPTLVVHGANDTNTPVVEAEQVVENLKERGIPVEYLLFPDEGRAGRPPPFFWCLMLLKSAAADQSLDGGRFASRLATIVPACCRVS